MSPPIHTVAKVNSRDNSGSNLWDLASKTVLDLNEVNPSGTIQNPLTNREIRMEIMNWIEKGRIPQCKCVYFCREGSDVEIYVKSG